MPPTRTRPPQLLIASHNHGAGAELLQLAERRGYAVRRAHSGAQALERAHAAPPDLVVLDESLTDMDAFAATRALRDDADVGPGTPLLLISAQRPSRSEEHTSELQSPCNLVCRLLLEKNNVVQSLYQQT